MTSWIVKFLPAYAVIRFVESLTSTRDIFIWLPPHAAVPKLFLSPECHREGVTVGPTCPTLALSVVSYVTTSCFHQGSWWLAAAPGMLHCNQGGAERPGFPPAVCCTLCWSLEKGNVLYGVTRGDTHAPHPTFRWQVSPCPSDVT